MSPYRPRWRWWLCCAALWLSWHTRWAWAGDLFSWCVLPHWLATAEELGSPMSAVAPWDDEEVTQ